MLKKMLDQINIGVLVYRVYKEAKSFPKQIRYVNENMAELMGFSREELISRYRESVWNNIYMEDLEWPQDKIALVLAGEIPFEQLDYDIRIVRKDKSIRWINVKGVTMQEIEEGWEFYLSRRDITERVEAQHKYKEELTYFTTFMKQSLAFFHCNMNSNVVENKNSSNMNMMETMHPQTVDEILISIGNTIPIPEERAIYDAHFTREAMIRAAGAGRDALCHGTLGHLY